MKTTYHLARLNRQGELTQTTPSRPFDSVDSLKAWVRDNPPRFVVNGKSRLVVVAVVGEIEVTTSVSVQTLDEATLAKHGLAPAEKI